MNLTQIHGNLFKGKPASQPDAGFHHVVRPTVSVDTLDAPRYYIGEYANHLHTNEMVRR